MKLPGQAWGTKGFEFWTIFSLLLLYARPERILELGSGRSTGILAEYAKAYNAELTSLETDEAWYNKAIFDLICVAARKKHVHLIRLGKSGHWYDIGQFKKLTESAKPFDFIFVDAPNESTGSSLGYRDSPEGLAELKECARGCDIMLVDDIHRKHVFETIDKMLPAPEEFDKYFYDYPVKTEYLNSLCICIRKSSRAASRIGDIERAVGVKLYRDFTSAKCVTP